MGGEKSSADQFLADGALNGKFSLVIACRPTFRQSGGMNFFRSVHRWVMLLGVCAVLPVADGRAEEIPTAQNTNPVASAEARRFLFAATVPDFSTHAYATGVEQLVESFEQKTGQRLRPGAKGKVALKLYTNSGLGMATPKELTRAVIEALERRGFSRENILLADLHERQLRAAGYLPPLARVGENFEGCPVLAWDSQKHFHSRWYYENPLASKELLAQPGDLNAARVLRDRLSYLPMPLILDVDFWINLPVAMDSPALGVSGALGNATIWNISNQRRFLDSPSNAEKAAVEIASIPELKKTFLLSILSLQRYQYIGGPRFDANYCISEKEVWLSANPLILDFLMMQRMNAARKKKDFPLIEPEPPMFVTGNTPPFALGSCVPSQITVVPVVVAEQNINKSEGAAE